MEKNSYTEKYNIILIILFFIIPLIAINLGYYFFADINDRFERKNQERQAVHEAELLGVEADFSNQFSLLFSKFLDVLKSYSKIDVIKTKSLINILDQNVNKIFESPFPKYSLYVFKIDSNSHHSLMLYSKGDIKGGKKGLSLAFDYLFETSQNRNDKNDKNETFARNLLGHYTKIEAIAKQLRGMPVNINYNNNFSLFIWDYFIDKNKNVYGSFLICDELENQAEHGRRLALKNLRSRGKAIGAFLPIYKEYGKAEMQYPLENSPKFKEWADLITIQKEEDLEFWLKNSLPQAVPLENYSAFCHLERGSSHIAVVLVKSIKSVVCPKWLIATNILLFLILSLIIYIGVCFGYWPKINLTVRFSLMYVLAAVLPLSLLFVVTYGYLVKFENTSENKVISELQSALKSFDSEKTAIVQEYRKAFIKALNDEKMINLINERGIEDEAVAKRVLEIFEKENHLPVLGIKILDEAGYGAYAEGGSTYLDNAEQVKIYDEAGNETSVKSSSTLSVNVKNVVDAFLSTQVKILRRKIEEEDSDAKNWMKNFEVKNNNLEWANKGYEAITGQELDKAISKYLSTPITRRTGDLFSIQIFDFIKINNKTRYMLFVIWDDKTLDERIVCDAINKNNFQKYNYSFAGLRIKSQKAESIGNNLRHASRKLKTEIFNKAKLVSLENKSGVFVEDNNIIMAMPSLNFKQIVFIGWIDKANIDISVLIRKFIFLFLTALSLVILWICIIRSVSVFLKPVSALKGALDEVSRGNLHVSLNNSPNDELGQLANEFSNMINGLKEKERLSKLISEQAVQALQKKSSGLLNDTESFNGVALVSDIRNFTGMSEHYDPVEITDLLNEHFAEMSKVISDNGGLIYKFIGDAIEAVFPENSDFTETAKKRAFNAGCLMIAKLAAINKRRTERNLFTYRIGVGLCYGTMYSGSVGSFETRLDYSILGEPLKKAAKYEALTILNPSFPLVVGVDIADKLAFYGFDFYKINEKGLDSSVYTLDVKKNEDIFNKHNLLNIGNNLNKTNSNSSESSKDVKFFSLQTEKRSIFRSNNIGLTWLVVFIVSIMITLGANFIYLTSFDDLKIDSDKECLRLFEQLNSNEVLKSSFEALCFDFYEDLYNVINSQNSNNNKIELIENIAKKYKELKKPIPKFCCLLANTDDKSGMLEILNKGFELETAKAMASYTWYKINDDSENQEKYLKQMFGEDITKYSIRSIYNRRSAFTTIDGQDVYLDTEGIYDVIPSENGFGNEHDQPDKLKAFIFCAMPKDMQSDYLADYYKVLAGKSIFLALNLDKKWVFSESYTEKEKEFLKENYKNIDTLEKEKGYLRKTIDIGNKTWDVYIIKKDLALYYSSKLWLNIIVFLSSLFLLIICAVIAKKTFIYSTDSVAGKLKTTIVTFTILPLIVVGFVSYLYVSEDYNVNKSETRLKLNKLMDEIENKELYYQPLYLHYLDKVSKSEGIVKRANKINSCKNDEEKQLLVAEFNNYLQKNVVGAGKNTFEVDPFFFISEVIVSGKNDWTSSIRKPEWAEETSNDTSLSETGKFISTIGKTLYLNNESLKAAVGNEMSENLVDTLASLFGAEFAIKFTNSPKELVLFSASFATIGFYTSPMPFSNKVDYILQAFLFFKNEFKPHICELKNNDKISLVKHYKTGSKDEKLFCFYSPNVLVGEYFFYNNSHYPNPKEELHTVKELGLASSWINSSFVPVSRTINLFGTHLLEARKGNIIADNVYAAISSEVPIREKAYLSLIGFGSIIIVSLIMIYCIAQNIILDLLAPITKLIDGAKSAAREDYSFRANFIRKDELGILCESFDKMMKGLEEKQLMNRMVSKTALKVSANVADVESKKINVVLLYVSVPGFDKIMKTTPIFELFTALRKQVADISEIVINNGGDIDKIMGEKMLIAFHINDKNPEDIAVQACKVAHMIESSDKLSFKVSVGVNYGQVISGFLGVGEKRDFTIIGDPVNVAARIAVFGEKLDKDKCLISESIYYYINSYIKADLYGEVELKGKSQAMKVYQIV